jgi:hypothetical protein
MGKLGERLSQCWCRIQGTLFPQLEEELDLLTEKQRQLVMILEQVRIEEYLPHRFGFEGRPPKTRAAIARSFVAKAVYNMNTTRDLFDRLQSDRNLRRICGWESKGHIPSESTFSRAFEEFAESALPESVHEALIAKAYCDTQTIVLHNSRDATAIDARERPVRKSSSEERKNKSPKRRGRPKKGEERPVPEPRRIEKQQTQSLEQMLEELPAACDIGTKKNSKGHTEHWIGYKLHLDTVDGGVPISAVLTSASLHDSQVAIPLATMSARRVLNLYDLMDAAYDVVEILDHSRYLGHIPLIDKNPRRDTELAKEMEAEAKRQKLVHWQPAEQVRYNERSTAERTNARLKDEFGGRMVRVRGHVKVACHLMFGVLALAADQLMRQVL